MNSEKDKLCGLARQNTGGVHLPAPKGRASSEAAAGLSPVYSFLPTVRMPTFEPDQEDHWLDVDEAALESEQAARLFERDMPGFATR